jgi:hypothetical protein
MRLPWRICWWTERAGRSKDKVARAGRLGQEMTMTLNWIAKRFNMGASGFLANLLREARRRRKYAIMWN